MRRATIIILLLNLIEGLCLWWGLFRLGPSLELWSPGPFAYGVLAAWGLYELVTFRLKVRALAGSQGEADPMVGLKGRALTELDPEGRVWVRGENWRALSLRGRIPKDAEIEILGRVTGRLEVGPWREEEAPLRD